MYSSLTWSACVAAVRPAVLCTRLSPGRRVSQQCGQVSYVLVSHLAGVCRSSAASCPMYSSLTWPACVAAVRPAVLCTRLSPGRCVSQQCGQLSCVLVSHLADVCRSSAARYPVYSSLTWPACVAAVRPAVPCTRLSPGRRVSQQCGQLSRVLVSHLVGVCRSSAASCPVYSSLTWPTCVAAVRHGILCTRLSPGRRVSQQCGQLSHVLVSHLAGVCRSSAASCPMYSSLTWPACVAAVRPAVPCTHLSPGRRVSQQCGQLSHILVSHLAGVCRSSAASCPMYSSLTWPACIAAVRPAVPCTRLSPGRRVSQQCGQLSRVLVSHLVGVCRSSAASCPVYSSLTWPPCVAAVRHGILCTRLSPGRRVSQQCGQLSHVLVSHLAGVCRSSAASCPAYSSLTWPACVAAVRPAVPCTRLSPGRRVSQQCGHLSLTICFSPGRRVSQQCRQLSHVLRRVHHHRGVGQVDRDAHVGEQQPQVPQPVDALRHHSGRSHVLSGPHEVTGYVNVLCSGLYLVSTSGKAKYPTRIIFVVRHRLSTNNWHIAVYRIDDMWE